MSVFQGSPLTYHLGNNCHWYTKQRKFFPTGSQTALDPSSLYLELNKKNGWISALKQLCIKTSFTLKKIVNTYLSCCLHTNLYSLKKLQWMKNVQHPTHLQMHQMSGPPLRAVLWSLSVVVTWGPVNKATERREEPGTQQSQKCWCRKFFSKLDSRRE